MVTVQPNTRSKDNLQSTGTFDNTDGYIWELGGGGGGGGGGLKYNMVFMYKCT